MKESPSPLVHILLALALACLALGARTALAADPEKVMGAAACAECHEKSETVWLKTTHHAIFKTTHRSDEGKEIAKKMGVRRMKSPDSTCAGCHYTSMAKDGKVKAVSGVSCESCHGAAADWLERHSEFSGKEEDQETPDEEAARWADSEAAGMIRPGNIYALATNCYSCHVTPDEDLVNTGGHPAGSEFNLLAWSQGEVRHNVWYSEANGEASAERKRQLYLAGLLAELETSLRALAAATDSGGDYASAMAARVGRVKADLEKAQAAGNVAGLSDLTGAVGEIAPGGAGLSGAADKVAAAAGEILAGAGALSGLDSLLPGPGDYVGEVVP